MVRRTRALGIARGPAAPPVFQGSAAPVRRPALFERRYALVLPARQRTSPDRDDTRPDDRGVQSHGSYERRQQPDRDLSRPGDVRAAARSSRGTAPGRSLDAERFGTPSEAT